jgi:catechol 2,3-dioxygenase-like lactoylglutathione lyase family enzyme
MTALGQIGQLDYTVLFARDLAAMRDFYKRVLEFPLSRRLSDRWFE